MSHACCLPSTLRLFIVIIPVLIDHVEESQLVDTLACRDNPQPVAQLLLLEELLRPAQSLLASDTFCQCPTPTSISGSVH
jgi:hypothetical protein